MRPARPTHEKESTQKPPTVPPISYQLCEIPMRSLRMMAMKSATTMGMATVLKK